MFFIWCRGWAGFSRTKIEGGKNITRDKKYRGVEKRGKVVLCWDDGHRNIGHSENPIRDLGVKVYTSIWCLKWMTQRIVAISLWGGLM